MRIHYAVLAFSFISTNALSDQISDGARTILTEIVINCPPHSIVGGDSARYLACSGAMDRWRLLSSAERIAAVDQSVETMAAARQEAEEAVPILAKQGTDKATFDQWAKRANAASRRWDDAVGAIREALRR